MNQDLTNLLAKVADNIEAKKTAAPDPSKVKAEDTAEIFSGLINYLDGLSAPPENPAGVSFTTAPTFTLGTNSIIESASVVNNNGDTVNVAGATIVVPYAAAGKKRLDSIVVNYLAATPVYERIAGDEVASTAIAARKPIPANRLFAHDIDVTDGVISTTSPTNAHTQNTDTSTTSRIFEIGKLTGSTLDLEGDPVEEPTGSVVLIFGKANDNTRRTAIREYWTTVLGEREYYLQYTLNYTGTGSDVWADFGAIPKRPTKTITGNYTVTAADHGYTIKVNSASAVIITLPTGLSGYDIVFKQTGAGAFTFQAGASATVEQFDNKFTSAGAKATVSVYSDNANVWTINGQLA